MKATILLIWVLVAFRPDNERMLGTPILAFTAQEQCERVRDTMNSNVSGNPYRCKAVTVVR